MNHTLNCYKDILEARRRESSNFMWISRELNTVVAYKQTQKPTPKWHKQEVLKSTKIQQIIRKIQQEENMPKDQLEQQLVLILDEIGFNKRLLIIRWLGLVLTKICLKVCSGIYVNEENILKVKKMMGSKPVIFLPSHRSYADFILMSYICFTYDIEIPSIAAGMDFHGMWGMGSVLRDTGAFFMRRSFNDDSLYWSVFRQYIHQLITRGDLPIEFFIEGTRSRSGKSLTPKFGLLSMVLKSYFTAEVPDILFVPINISYDRVLEEKLFAFELLGVPKPKESTSSHTEACWKVVMLFLCVSNEAFFKSLSIVKEQYGNIYVDFAEPISARSFFGKQIDRSVHSMKPIHMQEFTQKEKEFTSLLAYNIVHTQQKLCVITTFNLVAFSLANNFILGKQSPRIDDLIKDVIWLDTVLKTLGALTDLRDPVHDVWVSVNIHKGLVQVNDKLIVNLVRNAVALTNTDASKLKGHALSQETMNFVVPFVMLQIYVNPILHYLINPAILTIIMKSHEEISKDILFGHFCFLRSLFSHEFVTDSKRNDLEFQQTLQHLQDLKVIQQNNDNYNMSENSSLQDVLCNVLYPFLCTYYVVCKILIQNTFPCEEKSVLVAAQAELESIVNTSKTFVNPYCLNLDTLSNCLNCLTVMSALKRIKVNGNTLYQVDLHTFTSIIQKIESYIANQLVDKKWEPAHIKITLESKL